jgi:hypothetical protein
VDGGWPICSFTLTKFFFFFFFFWKRVCWLC